jgi:pyruvate dehydrogenase E2 component (dihydrolipoamide acetyltransferase)
MNEPEPPGPLNFAERWICDGFRVLEVPGGFAQSDVDMTRAKELVARLRGSGVHATYNMLVVRAAALAISRKPELQRMVVGTRRYRNGRVDIGLSVKGSTGYAPIMVIEDAGQKRLPDLIAEITRRIPEVQDKEAKDLASMSRWGWLIPFGFLRRLLLRFLFGMFWFRRRLAGTFQISCLDADVVCAFLFPTAACLGVGRVRDRVVAVAGQPVVRPMITLTCSIDHKSWDGMRIVALHADVRRILEDGELDGEVPEAVAG